MNISFIVKQLIDNEQFNSYLKKFFIQEGKKTTVSDNRQVNRLLCQDNLIQEKQNIADLQSTDQVAENQTNSQKRFSINSTNCLKRNSRQSISSLTATNYFKFKTHSETSVKVDDLVNQISVMLTSIKNQSNDVHLQSQLNQYQVMRKMQQMHLQFEKEYQKKFNDQKESLRNQVEKIVIQLNQKQRKQRKNKKTINKNSILKKERKNVAASILDITRNKRQFSGFHEIEQASNFCSDSDSLQGSGEIQKSLMRNSQQLSSISSKLQKVEKLNQKKIKQMWEKFKHELEENTKDIQKITDRIIQWKLRNEQKIENGFSGIWNIITQKEDQVSKLNLRIQLIEEYIGVKDL